MAAPVPQTVLVAIDGPIARTDLPGLCEQVSALIESSGADVALCDVSKVAPDAVIVDAVMRLQVAAQRRGCQARLHGASSELFDLLAFMGLRDILND